MHALLLTFALMHAMSQAFGNHETWSKGQTHGVSEFVIMGKGQSQLYLACDDYGSQPSSVIFTDATGLAPTKQSCCPGLSGCKMVFAQAQSSFCNRPELINHQATLITHVWRGLWSTERILSHSRTLQHKGEELYDDGGWGHPIILHKVI